MLIDIESSSHSPSKWDVGQNPPRTKTTRTKTPPDIIPPGQKPSRTKNPFYILFDYSKHSFKNVTLFCYTLFIYLFIYLLYPHHMRK